MYIFMYCMEMRRVDIVGMQHALQRLAVRVDMIEPMERKFSPTQNYHDQNFDGFQEANGISMVNCCNIASDCQYK